MADIEASLERVMSVDGAIAAALVDSGSGYVLGKLGDGLDMQAASAGSTDLVRAKLKTVKALNLDDMIEDPDPVKGQRTTAAMLTMVKLDIAKLEAAYNGN